MELEESLAETNKSRSQMFDANDSLIPPIHSKTEMSHAL